MDPNATLRLIDDLITDIYRALQHGEEHAELAEELRVMLGYLRDWLRSGGFEPDWDAYPGAARQYREFAHSWH